ncbi:hypothetical protein F5H01DRAFT_345825 [Linnemannia elongata]|nr:hypothetical protein F5H01DRAFT_345825 [Linnemannia elongata]
MAVICLSSTFSTSILTWTQQVCNGRHIQTFFLCSLGVLRDSVVLLQTVSVPASDIQLYRFQSLTFCHLSLSVLRALFNCYSPFLLCSHLASLASNSPSFFVRHTPPLAFTSPSRTPSLLTISSQLILKRGPCCLKRHTLVILAHEPCLRSRGYLKGSDFLKGLSPLRDTPPPNSCPLLPVSMTAFSASTCPILDGSGGTSRGG